MKPTEAAKAILARWMTAWPGPSGGLPYVFDNDKLPEPSTRYARVEIVSLTSDQISFGNPGSNKFENTGWIQVKLSGPADEGRDPLDALAEIVRDIYQTKRFGNAGAELGISTHATSIGELRKNSEAPGLWTLFVRTPFEYYETR